MMRIAGLPLPVVKEIRALSFAWLACLVTMLAAAVMGAGQFRSLGVAAYFFGAAALGAVSIGHEYSHRTLTTLLAQPARRERLLLVKLAVLLVMLLLLCTVAAVVVFNAGGSLRSAWPSALLPGPPRSLLQGEYVLWALWLPVLGGLIVAPWLTMLFRNPIAGTVFTVTIPGMLALAGQWLGMAVYGRFAPEVDGFRLAFFRASALGLCTIGAVMGWRTFMRLEALDRRDPGGRLPAFALGPFAALRRGRPEWLWRRDTAALAARASTKRHPVWLLVKKELHLQQMTFVVAGLHVLGCLALVSSRQLIPEWTDNVLDVFTTINFIYAFLISLLIGLLASAEERQLGTIEWQAMLPVATWKQWIVKVSVALGLTLVVGIGLTAIGTWTVWSMQTDVRAEADVVQLIPAVLILFSTVGGLYVSSLCSSGIQALVISATAMPAVALVIQTVLVPLGSAVFTWSSRLSGEFPALGIRPGDMRVASVLALLLGAVFVALVLRFAMANHGSAERGAARVWRQLIWMAALLTIGVALWAGLAGSIR